jgi:glycosyltransferase involved in cell wall biosynthesis
VSEAKRFGLRGKRERPFAGGIGRTLVFSATYNEVGNVREFCRRVLSVGADHDLLVVDDGSPDGTGSVLDRLARSEPRLTVVHRRRKLGLGSAHKLAMLHALKHGYHSLVTMDGDLSHDPADIPRLLDALGGCDFVIGSRYMNGGSSDYAGYRRAVSRLANRSARALLGIPLNEFTTSFRAFRVEGLRGLDISGIRSQGYSFFLESVVRIARRGLRCREVPIHFSDRKAGRSKIPRLEILRGMSKLLGLVFLARRRRAWTPRKPQPSSCAFCGSEYVLDVEDGPPVEFRTISCLHCGRLGPARRPEKERRERALSPTGQPTT